MAAPTSPSLAGAAGPPAAPAAPPHTPRRLLLVLTWCALGLALLATAGAAWMVFFQAPHADAVTRAPAHVFRVGTLVVNVAATNGRRYLRTTVEVAAASARESRRLEEYRTPLVDAALGVLGATPLDDLLDHTKRDALKTELRRRLNATVGGEPIAQVFFTEFVIQ
jgi:flagellar basal body-associated protein FliL